MAASTSTVGIGLAATNSGYYSRQARPVCTAIRRMNTRRFSGKCAEWRIAGSRDGRDRPNKGRNSPSIHYIRFPTKMYSIAPLRGLMTHQKGLYHDGRFATLQAVIDHYDSLFRTNLSDERPDFIAYLARALEIGASLY